MVRAFPDRRDGRIAIFGVAENDDGRLRRVLIEMANGGNPLGIGQKQVREDQVERTLL